MEFETAGRSNFCSHPVFITGGKSKFTYPDGKSETIEAKPGQLMWFGEAWEHQPENLGDGHFEVVYVELKD